MRYTAFSAALLLLFLGAAFALTFEEIEDNLAPDKNTKVYAKRYWETIEDTEVSWSGTVVDVKGGFRDRYKVYVKIGTPVKKKYDVVLIVYDDEGVTRLKKGQKIRFTGTLRDYSDLLGRFSIVLDDAALLR